MACEDLKQAYDEQAEAWGEAIDDLLITGGLALGTSAAAAAQWAAGPATFGAAWFGAVGTTTVAATQIYNHTDKWDDFLTVDDAYEAAKDAWCDCIENS